MTFDLEICLEPCAHLLIVLKLSTERTQGEKNPMSMYTAISIALHFKEVCVKIITFFVSFLSNLFFHLDCGQRIKMDTHKKNTNKRIHFNIFKESCNYIGD